MKHFKFLSMLVISLTALAALGGCVAYTTPGYGYYNDNAQVYVAPPPVYVAPRPYVDPWYAGPPVYFNFGYRSWGGSRGHYGGHRGHGGRGRGHRH